MSKSDFVFYGFIALAILGVALMFGAIAYSDAQTAAAVKECEEACWPAAAKRIDKVCHCGTVEGWVRQ